MITTEEFNYMIAHSGTPLMNENGSAMVWYAIGEHRWCMRKGDAFHSLYAGATDLDRLNAHWEYFANAA